MDGKIFVWQNICIAVPCLQSWMRWPWTLSPVGWTPWWIVTGRPVCTRLSAPAAASECRVARQSARAQSARGQSLSTDQAVCQSLSQAHSQPEVSYCRQTRPSAKHCHRSGSQPVIATDSKSNIQSWPHMRRHCLKFLKGLCLHFMKDL